MGGSIEGLFLLVKGSFASKSRGCVIQTFLPTFFARDVAGIHSNAPSALPDSERANTSPPAFWHHELRKVSLEMAVEMVYTSQESILRGIITGTQPKALIPAEPFRLDPSCAVQPSRFRFELLIGDRCYDFSFAVTRKRVVEERLVEILKTAEN